MISHRLVETLRRDIRSKNISRCSLPGFQLENPCTKEYVEAVSHHSVVFVTLEDTGELWDTLEYKSESF